SSPPTPPRFRSPSPAASQSRIRWWCRLENSSGISAFERSRSCRAHRISPLRTKPWRNSAGGRMQVPDDGDVVRRLAGDDPAALEDAYARYAGRCRAVAFRTLGDDALAQDAVQEAFVALWRHRTGLVVR